MRGKSLKWLALLIPFIFSLVTVNVVSSPETVLYVDPQYVIDETLQAGDSFTVDINVADVSDLKLAQINMSWNPNILNFTTAVEGDFMSNEGGPEYLWHGKAWADEALPFFEQTKVPTSAFPEMGPWLFPLNVKSEDTKYATCSTPDAEVTYGDFGFSTSALTAVVELEVELVARLANVTYEYERDYLELQVTNDGGTTWGPIHDVAGIGVADTTVSVDLRYDFAWTPSMLSNANFKAKLKYKQFGPTATTIYVNYLPIRVADALVVDSPFRAHDDFYDLPATINYGSRDGSFTVTDWGHLLPSGPITDPMDETSNITRVDFKMKYEAQASGSDQYRIVWYQPIELIPSGAHVLQGWTSSAASLANYTWANQIEPDNGWWDWDEIDNLEFVVETNAVGGDPNALFKVYEAWLEVQYHKNTVFDFTGLDQDAGWLVAAIDTVGPYIWGATGSGWLCTLEFLVVDYGLTELDIDDPLTKLLHVGPPPFPPYPIPFTAQNGLFKNTIPGDIQGDTPGTPPDGDVDRYDFFAFLDHYGSSAGDPNYNILADLEGDTPGSPPDGDVDRYDFFAFLDNYGRP